MIYFEAYEDFEPIIYGNFYNCHDLIIPKDGRIRTYAILMNNSVFKHRTSVYDFMAYMHYPNHLTLSSKTLKLYWNGRKEFENFDMGFWVTGVEVIMRRNKRTNPCDEDRDNFDTSLILKHIRQVGCRSPVYSSISSAPICNSSESMRKALHRLRDDNYGVHPPCKTMEKIYYTYQDPSMKGIKWDTDKDRFWISVYLYDSHFKYILKNR